MCQQATLLAVIGLIPGVYNARLESAFALLFMLLTTDYAKPPLLTKFQDPVSLVLFEEDKPNSYVEKVVLLEYISLTLEEIIPLISIYSSLLQDVALKVKVYTTDLVYKLEAGSVFINPWSDPYQFYTHLWVLEILILLRNRCTLASEHEKSSVVCANVFESENKLRTLSARMKSSLHPLYKKKLSIILQ